MCTRFCVLLLLISLTIQLRAQDHPARSLQYITVAASEEFEKPFLHQLLLGRNWRKEWEVAVRVPVAVLDTLEGGLVPYKSSGSGESKSLRLRSHSGKEWALRSVAKARRALLPFLLKHSFYGALVQDGVSMSHPYAAFALPAMMRSAGIYHSRPKLFYIPRHAALDTFNQVYGNNLYLLEERPVSQKENSAHLGSFKEYIASAALKDSLQSNNRISVDQPAFIKARLFDLFISDVDRHEGNWNWGRLDTGAVTYVPIPNDGDQAFFKHNGLITRLSILLTRRRNIESFRKITKNLAKLTNHKHDFDGFFANQMTSADWQNAAVSLQQSLTDSIILHSVRQQPPEVFAVSGESIVDKLKHRREQLQHFAAKYYSTLAGNVAISGTTSKEYFEVKKISATELEVRLYGSNSGGQKEPIPYYKRIFQARETKRITLNGLGGADVFTIEKGLRGIKLTTKNRQ